MLLLLETGDSGWIPGSSGRPGLYPARGNANDGADRLERPARGEGRLLTLVIYRIGVTMYRDPGLEQWAHDSALFGRSVNTPVNGPPGLVPDRPRRVQAGPLRTGPHGAARQGTGGPVPALAAVRPP